MAREQEKAELYKTIWKIADELRGSMDGWDFKSYVLCMLFYRYPRIVIGQSLIKNLTYPLEAKYNRQPYHQYIKRFNDGMVGFTQLIFFQVMSNTPDVIKKFSFDKLLHQSKYVIIDGLDQNMCDTHIFEKYQWLKEEYNQLILSDAETKKNKKWKIQDVQKADSRGNIHFKYINNLYDCEG